MVPMLKLFYTLILIIVSVIGNKLSVDDNPNDGLKVKGDFEDNILAINFNFSRNNIQDEQVGQGIFESRGWKKSALPFLLGTTMKLTALLPIVSSLMTIIGGVALVTSKLALIISVGLAIHYYLVTKNQLQQYRQQSLIHSPIYDGISPVASYQIGHKISGQKL